MMDCIKTKRKQKYYFFANASCPGVKEKGITITTRTTMKIIFIKIRVKKIVYPIVSNDIAYIANDVFSLVIVRPILPLPFVTVRMNRRNGCCA
jgi:hypothetical protein